MRVEFLGGVRTVTGSSTLLERGTFKWLVDCGLFQGGKELEERNRRVQSYRPQDLQYILLTHAHIDHSGLIPKLVKEGFQGKILCTKATLELCEVMLKDSAHIHEMEAEWQSRKRKRAGGKEAAPLYTMKDAENSLRYFQSIEYNQTFPLTDGVKVRFQDAGHILGSAIIEIWVEEGGEEKKLVFSGDLGNSNQPIVRDPTSVQEGDVLWLESTYGNRLHKSKEETHQELLKIIQEAISHHAKVIIPAFAVERTQDIIYTLGQFMRGGLIPSSPSTSTAPSRSQPQGFLIKTQALLTKKPGRFCSMEKTPLIFLNSSILKPPKSQRQSTKTKDQGSSSPPVECASPEEFNII